MSSANSAVVLELAEEFLARYRNGERPSLQEYVERYPDLASEIREVFPAMALMENIALADDSLVAPPTKPVPTLTQLGDYRILREIGRGGMGIVYEAEQLSLGRHVALKVLPAAVHVDARHRRRFEREAKAAAKLHHTNIVPVFGVGDHDGLPYYIMQFIQGQGLNKVLEELRRLKATPASTAPANGAAAVAQSLLGGRFAGSATIDALPSDANNESPEPSCSSVVLPGQSGSENSSKPLSYWQSVAHVGVQVASALDYAHHQGILHRDIKPSNLLLDNRGTVWVTDFGLAKLEDQENLTNTGDILGTLRYMPPEAFEGKADRRSDVYALGLTLYELLALRPAFGEKDRNQLIKQVTSSEPPRLDSVNPSLPRDLVTVVHKAMDRDPSHRYATAGELAADLQRFLQDQPILARRQSSVERLGRWCRRNPLVASLLAAVVVVTGVGFAATLSQMRVALHNEQEARDNAAVIARQRDEAQKTAEALKKTQVNLRATLYVAHVNQMQTAWNEGKTGRVVALLNLWKPQPGQTDPRGWEWHYFHRLCHSYLTNVDLGRPLPIQAYLSPEGKRIAHLSHKRAQDGSKANTEVVVNVWDIATGKLVLSAPVGGKQFASGELSPTVRFSQDGSRVAVLLAFTPGAAMGDGATIQSGTRQLSVVEVASGQRLLFVDLNPFHHFGSPLAFSRDGESVAVIERSTEVKIWKVAGGTKPVRLTLPPMDRAASVEFNADGTRLLASSYVTNPNTPEESRFLTVWDTATAMQVRKVPLALHIPGLLALDRGWKQWAAIRYQPIDAISGRSILVLGDVATGKEHRTMAFAAPVASDLVFSPQGDRLAGAHLQGDPTVWIWDVATGLKCRSLHGHVSPIVAVAFSDDGQRVVAAASDGTVKTWDATGNDDPFRASPDPVVMTRTVCNNDGTLFALNSHRWAKQVTADPPDEVEEIRVLDSAGKERSVFNQHKTPILHMAFSPDSSHVVSVAASNHADRVFDLRVWDTVTGQERWALQWPAGAFRHLGGEFLGAVIAFRPDGKRLAIAVPLDNGKGPCCQIQVRNTITGQILATVDDVPIQSPVIRFSPDGRLLLAWGTWPQSMELTAWDAETARQRWSVQTKSSRIADLAFLRHGTQLAMLSYGGGGNNDDDAVDADVTILDAHTGAVLRTMSLGKSVYLRSFAVSPDGKWVAAAVAGSMKVDQSWRNTVIKIWDGDTGTVRHALPGHVGWLKAMRFSPDSCRLVTFATNNTAGEVKLWDLSTGQEMLTLKAGLVGGSILFSRDGHRLILVGDHSHGGIGGGPPLTSHATIWDATPLGK